MTDINDKIDIDLLQGYHNAEATNEERSRTATRIVCLWGKDPGRLQGLYDAECVYWDISGAITRIV